MKVEANDPDLESKLEYSVIGNILPSEKSENLENIKAPPFLLDKNSGEIILNFDPQKGMKGYFAFHVSVRDGFGHAGMGQGLHDFQKIYFTQFGFMKVKVDKIKPFYSYLTHISQLQS